MEHLLENNTLTLFLEGELNSYNSEDVENEIESIISNNSFDAVVIDLEKMNYISSAGIRIIVRLKQRFDDTSIRKVPSGIYDIFEMVGLPSMIKITK